MLLRPQAWLRSRLISLPMPYKSNFPPFVDALQSRQNTELRGSLPFLCHENNVNPRRWLYRARLHRSTIVASWIIYFDTLCLNFSTRKKNETLNYIWNTRVIIRYFVLANVQLAHDLLITFYSFINLTNKSLMLDFTSNL